MTWRKRRDRLYRGDTNPPTRPTPTADNSLVRHILYIGGRGRETPYQSTSEVEEVAREFAPVKKGKVHSTYAPHAESLGLKHISRMDLLNLLKGRGKGHARWASPYVVMQARKYVEQSFEHLIDFSGQTDLDGEELDSLLTDLYE
ncbi:MAG: hypothetical protein KAI47_10885 [Deltaproteobacteria bacterium]|nr:hypothetical protein [Deltaproteobacteria bacterium]